MARELKAKEDNVYLTHKMMMMMILILPVRKKGRV